MIIDSHAHVVNENYGNVEKILYEYNKYGIDKGILFPGGMLDVRKMTLYIKGIEIPNGKYIPNDVVLDSKKKYSNRFYGFYCINPNATECIADEIKFAMDNGFVGIKLAPIVHQFSLTSNTVYELAEICGEYGLPIYTHVVYSPAASTNKVYRLSKQFRKTNFILGHMGFGPADIEAVQYAKECDNLFLETSQGSQIILEEAIKVLGSTKLIFGSEFPMYSPGVSLESIKALELNNDEFNNICCKNILNLIRKVV
jgi:hypothetical protein